jgi:hypothetical protein
MWEPRQPVTGIVLHLPFRSLFNGSTSLCSALAAYSFLILYTVGRAPWTVYQPRRNLYAGQHKHRINAHTDIHALNVIRTHNPSVRASEDS